MALRGLNFIRLCALLLWYTSAQAANHQPFPPGFSMANMGAVMAESGASARQPWVPAALYYHSHTMGAAAAGVIYNDEMEGRNDIYQVAAGGFYASGRAKGAAEGAARGAAEGALTLKGAYSYYSAMDMYAQHSVFVSAGTRVFANLVPSVELEATRVTIDLNPLQSNHTAALGISLVSYFKYLSLLINASGLGVYKDKDQVDFDPSAKMGVYTRYHSFGAQGFTFVFKLEGDPEISLRIGERLRLSRGVSFSAGFSSRPLMMSFGLLFELGGFSAAPAVAAHSQLGWSKGLAVDFAY